MIHLICGEKGKGKTKFILEKANNAVKVADGNVVYVDKSNKHMYELNKLIRLIDIRKFLVSSPDEFTGFISGMVSKDHDLQKVFLDSFLKLTSIEHDNSEQMVAKVEKVLVKLDELSQKFDIDMTISISLTEGQIPDNFKKNIEISL